MVSSSVRMLHWIHRRTTDLWKAVPLHLELVMIGARLEHRLLNSAAASTNTDNGATAGGDCLSCP